MKTLALIGFFCTFSYWLFSQGAAWFNNPIDSIHAGNVLQIRNDFLKENSPCSAKGCFVTEPIKGEAGSFKEVMLTFVNVIYPPGDNNNSLLRGTPLKIKSVAYKTQSVQLNVTTINFNSLLINCPNAKTIEITTELGHVITFSAFIANGYQWKNVLTAAGSFDALNDGVYGYSLDFKRGYSGDILEIGNTINDFNKIFNWYFAITPKMTMSSEISAALPSQVDFRKSTADAEDEMARNSGKYCVQFRNEHHRTVTVKYYVLSEAGGWMFETAEVSPGSAFITFISKSSTIYYKATSSSCTWEGYSGVPGTSAESYLPIDASWSSGGESDNQFLIVNGSDVRACKVYRLTCSY